MITEDVQRTTEMERIQKAERVKQDFLHQLEDENTEKQAHPKNVVKFSDDQLKPGWITPVPPTPSGSLII